MLPWPLPASDRGLTTNSHRTGYDMATMPDFLVLLVQLLVTAVRLMRPGGVRSVMSPATSPILMTIAGNHAAVVCISFQWRRN